jgi:hypothetical protein
MTTTPAPITSLDNAPFKAELTVSVYLTFDDETGRWVLDTTTVDGAPLDTGEGVYADLFKDSWTPENRAEMERAAAAPVPTGDEVALMLLAELGPETKTGAALAEIIDAAGHWSRELVDYIAKASDNYGDDESGENQRKNAADISAAIELLTGR